MATGNIKNLSPHHNFSAVPTDVLTSNKLSATAKGLLAFLLSLPTNHNIDKKDLPNYFTEGYYALNKAFEELVKKRFIHKVELRNKKGHFKGFEYRIYDTQTRKNGIQKVLPNSGFRKSGNQESGGDLLNQIHNEDCLVTMDNMPDQYIDLVLTSMMPLRF